MKFHCPHRCRAGALAAALAAALALGACGDPSASSLLGSARGAIEQRDTEAARLHLKAALQQEPNNAEARFLMGRLMFDAGDMVGAEVELRRAMELQFPETQVLPLLAQAMVSTGKSALALQQFGTVRLADALPQARLQTALAQGEATVGSLDAANSRLAEVLRSQPDHLPALLLKARLAAAAGDSAGALAQVSELLKRQADNSDAWMLKGDLLARPPAPGQAKADSAPAIAAYREALQRKPDLVGAHAAILTLLLSKPDLDAANAQWQAMQKALPKHPQTVFFEAMLAETRNDHKRTRELTQQLLRAAPDNPQVLMLAGQAELRLGNLAQAEAHFSKTVGLAPKAAQPRLQLAQVLLRSGQADKTLATLAPLVDGDKPDPDALSMVAQAQMMKGNAAAAEANFARAAKLRPDDPRVRTALALTNLGKGKDREKALGELRAVAAADKGTATDQLLIEVLIRTRDLPSARKAVDALAQKQPGDPMAEHLRGRIAQQDKDLPGARKHFEAALQKNQNYLPSLAALAALDLQDKKPAEAKARFESLLQREPKNTNAMLALAELTARSGGAPAEVQKWLEQAVAADPAETSPRLMLVDHLLGSNQTKQAIDAAQAGLSRSPDSPELLDRLGRAQLAAGEGQQAATTFGKLATLQPRSALAQLRLADAHAAARNTTAMAAAVRRAAELEPDQPQVKKALANLALMEDKPDQALALARRIQTERPDDASGYTLEAEVETRRRNWDAAAAALRKAMAKPQPGEAPQRLHAVLMASKKTAEAEAFATDWRRKHPEDMAFALHLGDQYLAFGKPEPATGLYREVLKRQPDNVLAMNNLAYALAMQKQPGAVQMAEQALAKAPKSGAVMDTLAFALAAEKNLERALEVQKQAVATAPETHQFRLQLARLLIETGDKPSARGELRTLAQLGSKFPRQAEVAALMKQTE